MQDPQENELFSQAPRSTVSSFLLALVIVAMAATLLTLILWPTQISPVLGKAPEIRAAGWLNGPEPTPEDLHGKVIVLDAWAYWCGPCRAKAPELVQLYEKYSPRGVLFLGLTQEGVNVDEYNRRFLETTHITWPNGYGAVDTLFALKADYIPQRWVIDRHYNLIWNEDSPEPIETAIDRALAEKL